MEFLTGAVFGERLLVVVEGEKKMIVAKRIDIDAAHFLPYYEGKCNQMHGHRWTIELAVEGDVDKRTGMVIDFTYLKEFLDTIKDQLDHNLINNIIQNPTAEIICEFIKNSFLEGWIQGPGEPIRFKWIKVWETPDSYALLEE